MPRIRILALGATVGLLPLFPFLAAILWGTLTESRVVWFFVSARYRHFVLGCFLAFPMSLAWAVVKDRIFNGSGADPR